MEGLNPSLPIGDRVKKFKHKDRHNAIDRDKDKEHHIKKTEKLHIVYCLGIAYAYIEQQVSL